MNTIGAAIDRGEIEAHTIAWEAFGDIHVPVCTDCRFVARDETGAMCTLFDSPYNSVEPELLVPMSLASLVSAIVGCRLKEVVT